MLLVGAGLLFHSCLRLTAVEPGFDTEDLITFRVPVERYDGEARTVAVRNMLQRLRAIPGVRQAGLGTTLPFVITGDLSPDIDVEIGGVLEDVHHWGQSEEPGPLVYILLDEWSVYFGRYYFAVRVEPGLQVAAEVRQAVWAVAPEIPVDESLAWFPLAAPRRRILSAAYAPTSVAEVALLDVPGVQRAQCRGP